MSNARKFCIGFTVGTAVLGFFRLWGETAAVTLNPFAASMAMGTIWGCLAVAWFGDSK